MTSKYVFYDTDITGWDEQNICGDEYRQLIQICCQYCEMMSLYLTRNTLPLVNKIKEYEIGIPNSVDFVYGHYGHTFDSRVRFYRICPELCQILLDSTNSVFDWIDARGYSNPSDPAFYRADGSVFFSSTTHDGECYLTPRADEEVSAILENSFWDVVYEQYV